MLDIPGPRGEGVIPLMAYTGRLGGGGGLPYVGYIGTACAAVKGMVFKQFTLG